MILKQATGAPCYANNGATGIMILYSTASIQTLGLEVSTRLKEISTVLMPMFIKSMQIALK